MECQCFVFKLLLTPGASAVKLFTVVANPQHCNIVSVSLPATSSLVLYLEPDKVEPLNYALMVGWLLALAANIGLGWKWLAVTKAVA